jgi:hypothetical protein
MRPQSFDDLLAGRFLRPTTTREERACPIRQQSWEWP